MNLLEFYIMFFLVRSKSNNLEELILKPSSAKFKRRQVALERLVSGNPEN